MSEPCSPTEQKLRQEVTALRRRVAELEAGQLRDRQMIESIQENEARFRILLQAIDDLIFTLDTAQRHVSVFGRWLEIYQLSPEMFIGKTAADIFGPAEAAIHQAANARCLAGETVIYEWAAETNFGRQYFETSLSPLRGADRTIQGIVGVGRNISRTRQAEAAARMSQDELETLFSQSLEGCFFMMLDEPVYWNDTVDKETVLDYVFTHQRLTRLNQALLDQYGAAAEQMLSLTPQDLFAHNLAHGRDLWRRFFDAGRIWLESDERRLDGRPIWIEGEYICLYDSQGRITGHVGLQRDVTGRKQVEEALRQRNQELELLNRIMVAVAENLSPEALLERACRELALAFDFPQAAALLLEETEITARVVAEYRVDGRPSILGQTIPLIDNPSITEFLSEATKPVWIEDVQTAPALDPIRPLLEQRGTASLLLLPFQIKGKAVGGVGLGSTTPRSFMAEEINLAWKVANQVAGGLARAYLAQSQRRLSAAVEQTDDSIIITDFEGTILYVNPAYERTSGYNRTEVINRPIQQVARGRHESEVDRQLWATIRSGQVWRGRLINTRKNGELYTDEATITPVRDDQGQIVAFVGVQRDVSRQLELEGQLRQAQKMEAIGQLAGGIAHDFNNILTAITGHVELGLQLLSTDHPAYNDMQHIRRSAQRAAQLTRQLLTFARRQPGQPQVVDLNHLTQDMVFLLRRLIDANIELVILTASEPAPVRIDPSQFEQLLLNLVVNARDAMPEGGKLTIETDLVDYSSAGPAGITPGRYIVLLVNDTGVGVSPELKERIFEPFFTTKEVGQGTGLGLSICFSIVEQYGGYIRVDSAPGQGSAFKVYLPQVEARTRPETLSRPTGALPRGDETILLVEDDPAVRELAGRILRDRGYTVVEAANGMEALRRVKEQSNLTIHLLVTDMVMPRLGGPDLAERLKARWPGLKVLFTSGYVEDTSLTLEFSGSAYLQKPFTAEALTNQVRQVLEASSPGSDI